MKTKLLLAACMLFCAGQLFAQVGINASGNAPNSSAMLDIESNTKGLLPPRMTGAERDAISNPAAGLRIYNTDTNCENFYNGSSWREICGNCTPQPTTANAGADQLGLTGTTATLAANTATSGTGAWSIESGSGGSLNNAADPGTTFDGLPGNTYTLRWTITNACGASFDEVDVSFVTNATNYPTGNAAYWAEKDLGFNDVTIAGGSVVYTYDNANKQYKNGSSILLPNLAALTDGETVNANTFYGFNGGAASDNAYQWDGAAIPGGAQGTNYSTDWDVTNMFVSPVSSSALSFCKYLQNSYGGACDVNSSTVTINSPVVYGAYSPGAGTYSNTYQGNGQISQGHVDVGGFTDYVNQQSLESGSYCTDTYGKGWRLPTHTEMGHQNDCYACCSDCGSPYDLGYATTGYIISSSRSRNIGGVGVGAAPHVMLRVQSVSNWNWEYSYYYEVNRNVRCVYGGGN